MATIVPTLPTAPARTQDNATFVANADAWVAALDAWTTAVNQVGDEVQAAAAAAFTTTSTSSVTIGTGAKTFTLDAPVSFAPGMTLVIASAAAPGTNYMFATVTSYNVGTGVLVVNATAIGGSGTKADWSFGLTPATAALLTTGGTMTGTLVTAQSATGQEALIIPPGVAPTSPTNGSIWSTAAGFFARIAGATRQLATLDGAETLVSKTIGDTGTVNASTAGFRGIPLISKTAAYTLALVDAGKQVSITTGGVVIPANGGVGFPIGTTIAVYNDSSSAQNISITTDTLRQAGTANTGTRALAGYGLATLVKVAATTWVISGAGLS